MLSPQSTESRGAWLWRKMAACFGERFYAMWRNVDEAEMQAVWTEGLHGITRENLLRGVSAMLHRRTPPTLGEFIELCEPVPAMYRQQAAALTDQTPCSPEVAEANLARMREILKPLAQPKKPGIAWAEKIIAQAQTEHVPLMKLRIAEEAIRNYRSTHPWYDRERDPGDDDEPLQEGAA